MLFRRRNDGGWNQGGEEYLWTMMMFVQVEKEISHGTQVQDDD